MQNARNPEKKWRALSEARYNHKLHSPQQLALNEDSSLLRKCNEAEAAIHEELRSDASSNSGPSRQIIKSHTPEQERYLNFPLSAKNCRDVPQRQRFLSLTGKFNEDRLVVVDVTNFPKASLHYL